MENITRNTEELLKHPKNKPLRVEFEILDFGSEDEEPGDKEIYMAYKKKANGIKNVFYDNDEEKVTGYFVVENSDCARNLIHLEGENIVGFDFTFEIEPY